MKKIYKVFVIAGVVGNACVITPDDAQVLHRYDMMTVIKDEITRNLVSVTMISAVAAIGLVVVAHLINEAMYHIEINDWGRKQDLISVHGRDKDIAEVLQRLIREDESSALVLGPAGVGKTALLEGLVRRVKENPNIDGKNFQFMQDWDFFPYPLGVLHHAWLAQII